MTTTSGGSTATGQSAAPTMPPQGPRPGWFRRQWCRAKNRWVQVGPVKALLGLIVIIIAAVSTANFLYDKIFVRGEKRGADIRYVQNKEEVTGRKVFDKTWVKDMHGVFYIPVDCPIQEGDYIQVVAAGLLDHWSSSPDLENRGVDQISPQGVDWTPKEIRGKQPFICDTAAVGSLMGVIGPKPVYDKEGIPLVKGGSRHFEIADERFFQVTKVTGKDDHLYLAMNRWWTLPAGREVKGSWGFVVRVWRP